MVLPQHDPPAAREDPRDLEGAEAVRLRRHVRRFSGPECEQAGVEGAGAGEYEGFFEGGRA